MLFEGFDDNDITALGTLWALVNTPTIISTAAALHQTNGLPTNARAIQIAGGVSATTPTLTTDHVWIGCKIRTSTSGGRADIVATKGGSATCGVILTSTSQIEIRRGGATATLLASAPSPVPNDTGMWVWIYMLAQSTSGDVRVYVNLSSTALVTFSGDTAAVATDLFDQLQLAGNTGQFDDVVILTDAEKQTMFGIGAGPSIPPQREVYDFAYVPNANGSTINLTASAGSNYQTVDERPFSTADYNSGSTAGQKDLFTFAGLGFVPPVIGAVKVVYYGSRDGTITGISNVLKSSTTTTASAAQSPGASSVYGLRENIYTLDPHTTASWSVSGVNAVEFGQQLA
jgi:hypothetical protein